MSLIGNDLVWLGDARNRGRSTDGRLLHRVLSPAERALVARDPEPDRALWALWAAKEAGFKAWGRSRPGLVFRPSGWAVQPEGPAWDRGLLVGNGQVLTLAWSHGGDWVHAWVWDGTSAVLAAQGRWEGDESAGTRLWAVTVLRGEGWPEGGIDGRPPVYRWNAGSADLSLSHDGPYAALATLRLSPTTARHA